jgi:hypothetical protein
LSTDEAMNAEMAYKLILEVAIAEAGSLQWDTLIVEKVIYNKMCKSTYWLIYNNKKLQGNGDASIELSSRATKATLFLRDNLLETTGQRIWGLTFTYHENGKFNIEYDYTKPEGFDD